MIKKFGYCNFILSIYYDVLIEDRMSQLDLFVNIAWNEENLIEPKSSVLFGTNYGKVYMKKFVNTIAYKTNLYTLRDMRDSGRLLFLLFKGKHN